MNLYTTCTKCYTVFKVHTHQLRLAGGSVRCGHCNFVFDAFETITTSVSVDQDKSEKLSKIDNSKAEDRFQLIAKKKESENKLEDNLESNEGVNLYETEYIAAPKKTKNLLWLLVAVLAMAIPMQLAFIKRQEIIEEYPSLYQYLIEDCGDVECGSSLIDSTVWLKIESSDLLLDEKRGTIKSFNALIRNLALFDLKYPRLELVLYDQSNKPTHKSIYLPRDYVKQYLEASRFSANSEISIEIPLNIKRGSLAQYTFTILPNKNKF